MGRALPDRRLCRAPTPERGRLVADKLARTTLDAPSHFGTAPAVSRDPRSAGRRCYTGTPCIEALQQEFRNSMKNMNLTEVCLPEAITKPS
jgi:hypothetical protein